MRAVLLRSLAVIGVGAVIIMVAVGQGAQKSIANLPFVWLSWLSWLSVLSWLLK